MEPNMSTLQMDAQCTEASLHSLEYCFVLQSENIEPMWPTGPSVNVGNMTVIQHAYNCRKILFVV